MEGYNVPGSRSERNNNPGDLEYGVFAITHGADQIETTGPHTEPRFAHFPDAATGFAAMKALLAKHYQGATISEMLNKYAPPVENQTNQYVANVCKWTGLTPETVIDEHL